MRVRKVEQTSESVLSCVEKHLETEDPSRFVGESLHSHVITGKVVVCLDTCTVSALFDAYPPKCFIPFKSDTLPRIMQRFEEILSFGRSTEGPRKTVNDPLHINDGSDARKRRIEVCSVKRGQLQGHVIELRKSDEGPSVREVHRGIDFCKLGTADRSDAGTVKPHIHGSVRIVRTPGESSTDPARNTEPRHERFLG